LFIKVFVSKFFEASFTETLMKLGGGRWAVAHPLYKIMTSCYNFDVDEKNNFKIFSSVSPRRTINTWAKGNCIIRECVLHALLFGG
jgi:hypothetical protein